MPWTSIALAVTCAVCAALARGGEPLLANGGFEENAGANGRPPGWTFELGAQSGGRTPESVVELDAKERHGGNAALRFRGDASTRGWLLAKQPIEVRPGGEYRLAAWARAAAVRPSGSGFDNCCVGLFFLDAEGKLVGREVAWPARPDSEWARHEVALTADARAREGYAYVFLSMLCELWVDDLELSIEGGEPLPTPEVALREGFEAAERLGGEWKRGVGATSAAAGGESAIEIDLARGANGTARSLRLSGDASTTRWIHPTRELPAEPGERWRWSALVASKDVAREGQQNPNLHVNLAFVDAQGKTVGNVRFGQLPQGTHDWTPLAVDGVAPEGTRKVVAGVFLSMSGSAWFDELELTVEKGLPPPYAGWPTLEGDGVTLRFSPRHARAAEMKAHLSRLEQSKRATCGALEVEFPDTITVFLYADDAEGKRLTGAQLDFADANNRRVHQRWESHVGHEMVHVIAHNALQSAKTELLGEGVAVWLNGQAQSHHAAARELLEKGELPSVADMLARFRELPQGYPAAGSFCGFLLGKIGLARFKELYPLGDPSARLREVEGFGLEELEAEWHDLLRRS